MSSLMHGLKKVFILSLALLSISGCAAMKSSPGTAAAAAGRTAAAAAGNTGAVDSLAPPLFTRTGNDPAAALVRDFNAAQSQIDIACYSFTHPGIIKALLEARKRGVKIRVLTDREQSREKTEQTAMEELIRAGIPVKINTHAGLMNLRMSIIDNTKAAVGSYNYNQLTGKTNDEMLAVINDASFAASCEKQFTAMWNDTRDFADLKTGARLPAGGAGKSGKTAAAHVTEKTPKITHKTGKTGQTAARTMPRG